MNYVTDMPCPSIQKLPRFFPWRGHAALSALFITGALAVRIQNYFDGRRFESLNAFSSQTFVILFLFISGVILLFAALGGLIEILRRREPWRKSGRLALPFAAAYGIAWLSIPDFIEAAGASIREKANSEELTSLARSVVDSPPGWLKEGSAGGFQMDKIKWMGGTSPLDRLGLGKYAFLAIQKETLQFSWGSSLSDRWGLAISAAPGIKPELPNDVVKAVAVYPDVWVYTLIDY